MGFIEFISNPYFQSVLAFLTIFMAAVSCWLTYRLTRPKVKVKIFKSHSTSGGYDADFVNIGKISSGSMRITFTNNSPNRTQIRDVRILYKRKSYSIRQGTVDYSKQPIKFTLKRYDGLPIYTDKLFFTAPIALDSFEEKSGYVIFPEFPITSKKEILVFLVVEVVGKKAPILKPLYFTKTEKINLPYHYEMKVNGTYCKLESSVPLYYKKPAAVYKKKKK